MGRKGSYQAHSREAGDDENMSVTDDDRNRDDGGNQTTQNPVRKKNRQIAVGAVGLAAVLSAGAYVATDSLTDKGTTNTDVGAMTPRIPASETPAAEATAASVEQTTSALASTSASASASAS